MNLYCPRAPVNGELSTRAVKFEIALGPKEGFENSNIGALMRQAPPDAPGRLPLGPIVNRDGGTLFLPEL